MDYKYTDKLYKKYALIIVRAFNSLNREFQALKFDELNMSKGYKVVYDKIAEIYKNVYDDLIDMLILLSLHYFEESCDRVISKKGEKIRYYSGKEDGFRKERVFDARKFVEDYVKRNNEVVKYIFYNEYERKLNRAVEAILSSGNKSEIKQELDKALRYWSKQAKQAGDNISMDAYIEGFKAMGVYRVKWVTEKDEKVCTICAKKDGKIYDIDKVIIPLHYNCRCNIVPAE